jgi:hypothetical protein
MTNQSFEKIRAAQARLLDAAARLASDPSDDEIWREICSARATLRAYCKYASC